MNRKSSFFDMQFITSSISTTMVLLLLGLVVYFVIAADKLSTYARENIAFFILIDDNTKETDILQFQKQLNQKPYVKQTTYISKNQALKEQTEAMGTDPTEFLGYNPFSASIEVKLNAIYTNTDSLRWIKNDIQSHKQVVELSYPQELLNAVNQNIQKLTIILLGLAILLTFISFALINNTIGLTIYSKRFLIYTMKLVGANWAFIRKPFLIRNIWIGIISAAAASSLLIGIAYTALKYEADLSIIITVKTMLLVIAAIFIFGILITSLCALFSINKYLKIKSSELYTM